MLAGVAVAVSILLACACGALIRKGVCSGNRDASQWEQRGPGQGGSNAEAHVLRRRSDFLEKQIQVSASQVSSVAGGARVPPAGSAGCARPDRGRPVYHTTLSTKWLHCLPPSGRLSQLVTVPSATAMCVACVWKKTRTSQNTRRRMRDCIVACPAVIRFAEPAPEALPVRARSRPQSLHPSSPDPTLFDINSSSEALSDIITSHNHSLLPEPRVMHPSYMHMRGTPVLHAPARP